MRHFVFPFVRILKDRSFLLKTGLLVFLFLGVAEAATLPEANLMVTPATGQAGSEMTFDASDSRNTNGLRGGLEYRFQFRNAEYWTPWSTQSIRKYTPMDIGTFRAKLQVRDQKTKTVQTTYREYRVHSDTYRHIRIRANPTRIRVGESVLFELLVTLPRTENPDDVKVRWDFDSDGYFETQFSQQRQVRHVFGDNQVGQLSPTAEVIFPDGSRETIRGLERLSTDPLRRQVPRADWEKIQILPAPVVPPVVHVSPGRTGFNEDTVFRFDASDSRIPDHAWIEWNFDGEQFLQEKEIVTKKFDSPGTHQVRARTCYDRAAPKCRETLITIEVTHDPIDYRPEIHVQNLTRHTAFSSTSNDTFFVAVEGDRLQFTAQLRYQDMTARDFSYRWDFQGDGVFDTPFLANSLAEYTIPREGILTPVVEVENEEGVRSRASLRLHVSPNTAPNVSFTVDTAEIYPGQLVRFYPKVSDLQHQHAYLETRFDADGDGNWDSRFRRVGTYQWRYEKPGTYITRMQVRDPSKKVTTVARRVTVRPYSKPTARVTISQREGDTRTVFRFDASRSSGQGLRYYWDFDFQGSDDLVSDGTYLQQGPKEMRRQFREPGEKQILLRVVDGSGQSDQIHFPVFVGAYQSPPPSPRSQPSDSSQAQTPPASPSSPSSSPQSPQEQKQLVSPDRPLVRADMFFLLYEAARVRPPFPGPSPFEDVEPTDWFSQAALLSYRQGLTSPPYFKPAEKVSPEEAAQMIQFFFGKDVSFGESVTRQSFREMLP
ncbi:hypothetical protein K9M59_01375 [Candidatus Gracilibacteria bacterium]|nr:hypothetical protein [Candidatus Gracilibacteria bacterium]MCF7819219.1 hypothetical protein [Candidatus Gracilibacteria bacterium]